MIRVICAWCHRIIRDGAVSHGICESCKALHFPEEA